MSPVKTLIDRILARPECEGRYSARRGNFSALAKHLPERIEDISDHNPPFYCHGLAFRMATYANDDVFTRLNRLYELPKNSNGWDTERREWEDDKDHWAKNWDRFYQFIWLLQCFEYLSAGAQTVEFLKKKGTASPDFKVVKLKGGCFYAEAYVYSKWWFIEIFLEELVSKIDPKLSLRRTHNIRIDSVIASFSGDNRKDTLEFFAQNLTPDKLKAARAQAADKSPCVICEKAGIQLVLEGEGEYQPDDNNAQGDAGLSRDVFIREIIGHKNNENGLESHRPNLLMVNGLGVDFQTTFFNDPEDKGTLNDDAFGKIDKLLIAVCGMDKVLRNAPFQILKRVTGT